MRAEEIRGLGKRRDRQAGRNVDDAVLDLAFLGDQHDQRPLGLEPHELDVLEMNIGLRGQHHAGRAGQPGEHARGFVEHGLHRLAGGRDLGLHGAPLVFGEVADLHQGVDEESQPELGRQPPGRGVRGVDQPELLEVRHHVAHGGRRQRGGDQARDIARAHRLAGRQIALDDLAENLARALVELREADLALADLDIARHQRSFIRDPSWSGARSPGDEGARRCPAPPSSPSRRRPAPGTGPSGPGQGTDKTAAPP